MAAEALVMTSDFTCKRLKDVPGDSLALSSAVGDGKPPRCQNLSADVRAVQAALNRFTPLDGGPEHQLVVDGSCGPKTKAAIWTFQRKWSLKPKGWKEPDGIVDPVGPTVDRLRKGPGHITNLTAEFVARLPDVTRVLTATRAALLLAQQAFNRPSGGLPSLGSGSKSALEAVNRHFHTEKAPNPIGRVGEITRVFDLMIRAIGHVPRGAVLSADEPPKSVTGAYMFTFEGGFHRWNADPNDPTRPPQNDRPSDLFKGMPTNSIYLCARARTLSQAAFTYAIIHELAHYVGPERSSRCIDDHAYFHKEPDKYRRLTADLAHRNADSYSQYAYQVTGRPDFNIGLNGVS